MCFQNSESTAHWNRDSVIAASPGRETENFVFGEGRSRSGRTRRRNIFKFRFGVLLQLASEPNFR